MNFEHIQITDPDMSPENIELSQELLDAMAALLMVYPNGGHGDSDDRGDAVNLAL